MVDPVLDSDETMSDLMRTLAPIVGHEAQLRSMTGTPPNFKGRDEYRYGGPRLYQREQMPVEEDHLLLQNRLRAMTGGGRDRLPLREVTPEMAARIRQAADPAGVGMMGQQADMSGAPFGISDKILQGLDVTVETKNKRNPDGTSDSTMKLSKGDGGSLEIKQSGMPDEGPIRQQPQRPRYPALENARQPQRQRDDWRDSNNWNLNALAMFSDSIYGSNIAPGIRASDKQIAAAGGKSGQGLKDRLALARLGLQFKDFRRKKAADEALSAFRKEQTRQRDERQALAANQAIVTNQIKEQSLKNMITQQERQMQIIEQQEKLFPKDLSKASSEDKLKALQVAERSANLKTNIEQNKADLLKTQAEIKKLQAQAKYWEEKDPKATTGGGAPKGEKPTDVKREQDVLIKQIVMTPIENRDLRNRMEKNQGLLRAKQIDFSEMAKVPAYYNKAIQRYLRSQRRIVDGKRLLDAIGRGKLQELVDKGIDPASRMRNIYLWEAEVKNDLNRVLEAGGF